jgi:hypothetical protein
MYINKGIEENRRKIKPSRESFQDKKIEIKISKSSYDI